MALVSLYVERRAEPGDRRARLVVPTARGLDAIRISDEIIRDIERRQAQLHGRTAYDDFRETLAAVIDSLAHEF